MFDTVKEKIKQQFHGCYRSLEQTVVTYASTVGLKDSKFEFETTKPDDEKPNIPNGTKS